VGSETTGLQPGDDVFGVAGGAFGEYVGAARAVAPKPANLTFEEAAAVPIAGLTALQALRDKGQVQPGQKVLVNGASGGVGTFTVQVAKALGAEVTGVCSPGNVELVRSLGADRVVDYTREDFTRSGERYDLMIDVAGSRSWSDCRRVLEPHAKLVIVGGPSHNRFLGPLGHIARTRLAALPASQKTAFFVAKPNRPDLQYLGGLLDAGTIRPAVDRRYRLGEIADALRYMGEGHARAKIVVTV
jgi:NADPH:quinone reductase-like Zn-dependent oxidoreductase